MLILRCAPAAAFDYATIITPDAAAYACCRYRCATPLLAAADVADAAYALMLMLRCFLPPMFISIRILIAPAATPLMLMALMLRHYYIRRFSPIFRRHCRRYGYATLPPGHMLLC